MRHLPETYVVWAMLLCVVGAGLTWVFGDRRREAGWISLGITAGSALLVSVAVVRLAVLGPSDGATFFPVERLGFALRLHVDGLSAVFLGLAALVAVPAALYSVRYLEFYGEESAGRYYPHLLVFLAAMYGLVSTSDMMWFFFIFWQMMTLPGYALIRYERGVPEHRQAARKYLVMMQIACLVTMLGAALLAGAKLTTVPGGPGLLYDFESVSARMPELLESHPGLVTFAFALFLIGFGIKMGMWPFGAVWLPDAHPAAPSPVSALLSGVMIKTGVYGLMRYFLWLVPAEAQGAYPMASWGWLIGLLGTVTLLVGTFQALRQEQTKRLLAFHSIGQVGYILLGTGVCMVLLPGGDTARGLGAVALFAALFHTVNHGTFKALLFLNAGAMLYRTGTQNLNQLGGLLRYMPITGMTALIAALAISGVPPLNGFASKWSLYVAAIQGAAYSGWLVVFAAIAILTSALTLASFIKFFGASMLASPSDEVRSRVGAGQGLEVGPVLWVPQVFLGAVCVLLGLAPALAYRAGIWVMANSPHGLGQLLAAVFPAPEAPLAGLAAPSGAAMMVPLVLVLLVGLMAAAGFWCSRVAQSRRRAVEPWACGYVSAGATPRFTAHHFYSALKPGTGSRSRRPVEPDGAGDSGASIEPPTVKPSA